MFKLLTKLLTNLCLLKVKSPSKKPVVFLMSGVFNPIHKQHIDTLEIAKREIEAKDSNIKVVAGYISPCSDAYAKRKLQDEAINADQRIEMIKLALEESVWIDIDEWEARSAADKNMKTSELIQHLLSYLNSNSEVLQHCDGVKVMLVVGSDSCSRKGRFKRVFEMGTELIVVNRDKDNPDWENECKSFLDDDFGADVQKLVWFFDSGDYEIRSTQIRSILKNEEKGDLEKFLHPYVLKYIEDNKILQGKDELKYYYEQK